MKGFLILFSILAGLLGWGFHAAPAAEPVTVIVHR